jgi:hypothetical protein
VHKKEIIAAALLTVPLGTVSAAPDAGSPVDKDAFNLFNPTPDSLLRDFAPDRPDKTDGPVTVDAGHLQWEMDFANYRQNRAANTEAWNLAPVNLRMGLLNNLEADLIYGSYANVLTGEPAGGGTRQSGFGDLTARVKINLWGNDQGSTAFGLLPFLKFPVNTAGLGNHAIEGGLGLPLSIKLPGDFDLGLETGVTVLKNDNDASYHPEFFNSVTVDHVIIGKLSGYLEFFTDISAQRHSIWLATLDTGLEYLLTANIQLDLGCNFGVTPGADDYNPFTGISIRF